MESRSGRLTGSPAIEVADRLIGEIARHGDDDILCVFACVMHQDGKGHIDMTYLTSDMTRTAGLLQLASHDMKEQILGGAGDSFTDD